MNKTVDKWIEDHKEELVADMQECLRYPSLEGKAEEGMPFGKDVNDCLESTLAMARRLTCNDLDAPIVLFPDQLVHILFSRILHHHDLHDFFAAFRIFFTGNHSMRLTNSASLMRDFFADSAFFIPPGLRH